MRGSRWKKRCGQGSGRELVLVLLSMTAYYFFLRLLNNNFDLMDLLSRNRHTLACGRINRRGNMSINMWAGKSMRRDLFHDG
jgi:hypothetical protein